MPRVRSAVALTHTEVLELGPAEICEVAHEDPQAAHSLLNGLRTHFIAEAFGSVPFFKNLPEATRRAAAALFDVVLFAKGEVIFRQGDPGDRMFIVLHGRVQVCTEGHGSVPCRANHVRQGILRREHGGIRCRGV